MVECFSRWMTYKGKLVDLEGKLSVVVVIVLGDYKRQKNRHTAETCGKKSREAGIKDGYS